MIINEYLRRVMNTLTVKDGQICKRISPESKPLTLEDIKNNPGLDLTFMMYKYIPSVQGTLGDIYCSQGSFVDLYSLYSGPTINYLLRGFVDPFGKESDMVHPAIAKEIIDKDLRAVASKHLDAAYHTFMPLPPYLVEQIIEMDEMLRASKAWNTKPITVYRGTTEDFETHSLLSTSLEQDQALAFYKGALLQIELPAGFPYIKFYEICGSSLLNEQEILLPPCKPMIEERFTETVEGYEHTKTVDKLIVSLKPLNLAEELLKAMENPPKEYPREYITNPDFGWERSKSMLRSYIENYVKQGKIKIGDIVIDEQNPSYHIGTKIKH